MGRMPTISISSPTLMTPRSTRPGHHRAAAGDGEHVFHRHQEGAVHRALGRGDVGVQRFGQLEDGLFAEFALVAFHRQLGAAVDDGGGVTGEFVLVQQLADFHLHQLQELGVVDHVALVQEHDDVRHADLARQQDVLAGLRHRAVGGGHDQDGAVHLRRAGDHVLDVVGVPRAVDVRVVAVGRLVLDVRGVDGDAARLFFGRRVDLVVGLDLAAELGRQHRGDRRRQRRLAVVDVADRAHVDVRLGAFEFAFCHLDRSWLGGSDVGDERRDLWCPWRGSNARPPPYQGGALPLSHMGIGTGLAARRPGLTGRPVTTLETS